jgi:hypothetical protein
MLKRPQNVAIVALATCFLIGFGSEVWRASNTHHSSIDQSAAAQKERAASPEGSKESAEEAIARYNKWLTIFTAVLAVATVGLGVATVGLYFAGERQLRHAQTEAHRARVWRLRDDERLREQIAIARQNADAAQKSAEASIQQAKIAENALVQLERPYIFIFGVRGIKQDVASQDFFVEYTVANYGKMPAIIEAPHIGFDISDRAEPPMPPLLHDSHNLMASPILQAGEQRKNIRAYFPAGMVGPEINVIVEAVRAADVEPNSILSGAEEPPETVFPTFNIPEGFDIFFRALIRYRGPLSAAHETGAVWLYNPGTFEFVIRGGEEHNYVK